MNVLTRREWNDARTYEFNGGLLLFIIALCLAHAYLAISRLQIDQERAEIDNATRVFEAIQQLPHPITSPTPAYQQL